jgi:hypothetical protein
VVSAFLERPLELGVRGAAGLVAFPVFMHGIGKRPGEHLLRLLTAAAVRGADRLRQGLGQGGKLGITLSMPVSAKTRRTGGPGMTSSTSPPSALALLRAAIRVCSPDESQNRVRVISTTSVVPDPVAAALSRADRSSSALAMSISAGAATTGMPCTTATGNLASGIRAPAVAACAAAVAGYSCRDGLHLMARETLPPRSRRSRRRGRLMQRVGRDLGAAVVPGPGHLVPVADAAGQPRARRDLRGPGRALCPSGPGLCPAVPAEPGTVEDLMQVGCAGLLKAINGFASEVGDSLSAYAARRRSRFRFSLVLAADPDVGRLKRTWTGVAICALACA